MKIEFVEKNYDIGVKLKELIEKKINKLDRYFDSTTNARVVCTLENKTHKMEITIKGKNVIFRSEVIGENMYENIDLALPKIERQIVKQSKKSKDYFRTSAFDFPIFEFLTEKPEDDQKEIIKTKKFDLEPLSVEDAKYNLENLDHDFYVFLNAESGKVNVLYNRKDGKLGLIECNY